MTRRQPKLGPPLKLLQPATFFFFLFACLSLLETDLSASGSSGVALAVRFGGNSLKRKYQLRNRAPPSDGIEKLPLIKTKGPSKNPSEGKKWYQKIGFTIFGPYSTKERLEALEKIITNKDTDKTMKASAEAYKEALLKLEEAKKSKDKGEIKLAEKNAKKARIKL